MAKYSGKIGFSQTVDKGNGVWEEEIIERTYYGDVHKFVRKWENSGNLNDNIIISNQISIIADPFANENVGNLRYVTWRGTKWKASSIDIEYPRFLLTLGGIYYGESGSST